MAFQFNAICRLSEMCMSSYFQSNPTYNADYFTVFTKILIALFSSLDLGVDDGLLTPIVSRE